MGGRLFCVSLPNEMMLVRNPIVWLWRVRHRNGYGVHSPFAFDFVTNVLYNRERYYAYEAMDRDLRWWQMGRVRSLRHLLFRLSNFRRPRSLYCEGVGEAVAMAAHLGSLGARAVGAEGVAEMIVTGTEDGRALSHLGEGSMVVLWDLRRQRRLWQRLLWDGRVTVAFDLYDVGVAFARKDLNRQHYIINW